MAAAGALLDDNGTKRSTGQEEGWTGAFMGLTCVERQNCNPCWLINPGVLTNV